MRRLFKQKKGAFTDGIFIFVFFCAMALGGLLLLKTMDGIVEGFTQPGSPQVTQDLVTNTRADFRAKIDNALILYFMILVIGSWISSFFLDNHPIYFVVFLLLSFISFFIGAPVANMMYSISATTDLISQVQYMPKTFFIINHLIAFLAFYVVTTGLVLFAKYKYRNPYASPYQQ